MPGRLQRGWDALQERLAQPVETVTRSARIDISSSGVDEIDPPEDIDEYWNQYQSTGIVRSNGNQFISDVVEPGVRVEADADATAAYFMGGDGAPESTPEGGFLNNCFVYAGERHQPFLPGLKTTIANRWFRGTALTELLKADREDADSPITGFYHIRPETVYPQVEANKNILLPPDPADLPAGITEEEVELTPRDEVAAYIQFDDQSILGQRLSGFDRSAVPLSQRDVMKQVLDPDIGGDDVGEQGVFGTSILEAVSTDITEYKATKRDRYRAIQTKAYGIWLANFKKEALDLGDKQVELVEWTDDSQDDFMDVVADLGPGDVMEADGPVDLEQFDSDVPDLESTLDHYVDDITAPLPAPKYSVGFEQNINQFVTNQQEARYTQLINEERQYQGRKWTGVFRTVAERHPDLDPAGLRVTIEPEESDSPALSLSDDEVDRIGTFATAFDEVTGTIPADTVVDLQAFLELIFDLPEDVFADVEERQVDETSEQATELVDELTGGGGAEADD